MKAIFWRMKAIFWRMKGEKRRKKAVFFRQRFDRQNEFKIT
jgi:hypothetical protein